MLYYIEKINEKKLSFKLKKQNLQKPKKLETKS